MIKSKLTYQIIGVLICLISIYWLLKTFSYLISYEPIIGMKNSVFGYPKSLSLILIYFFFWIFQLIGGIGIIKSNIIGLKIGLISTLIGGITLLISTSIMITYRSNYSVKRLVNDIEQKMTLLEKVRIIYGEPVLYVLMTISSFLIVIMIFKKLKLTSVTTENTSSQHNV